MVEIAISARDAVFVLNLSDIILLQTAPHTFRQAKLLSFSQFRMPVASNFNPWATDNTELR